MQIGAKSYFIRKVDGEILGRIKDELKFYYYTLLERGKFELPEDIRKFRDETNDMEFKHTLYRCIASWYVETETAIDLINRIQLYQIMDRKKK